MNNFYKKGEVPLSVQFVVPSLIPKKLKTHFSWTNENGRKRNSNVE